MNEKRRKTTEVLVGKVGIGENNPIRIQSMTLTPTEDISGTVAQIKELVNAGSELVRVTVNTEGAARAVPHIKESLLAAGIYTPLIGDFHFNGHVLLTKYPECAAALQKYRVNPGTVSGGAKRNENFSKMIDVALAHEKPIRIGVNWGSVDKKLLTEFMEINARPPSPRSDREILFDALVASVITSAHIAENHGLPKERIIVSAKLSRVSDLIAVNRRIASECQYPIHIGLTEAGTGRRGMVASAAGLAILLSQGIGDTIRVSITPGINTSRTEEVEVCKDILQSLGMRNFSPSISACPGCGRTSDTAYIQLADTISHFIAAHMPEWKRQYPGVENLKIAVMGCVVNGPGESRHADIGISLPGIGENPKAPVYIDGAHAMTLSGKHMARDFMQILESYIQKRFKRV